MGRAPCCDKANVKKGPWSPEEDAKLKAYIEKNGTGGNWIALPQKIGLKRCGKSCRLRWLNYLRPNIKHGGFSEEEDNIICSLYISIGSRWSIIAAQLPGRTDNDIKNYWNTRLKKKLLGKQRNYKEIQLARTRINNTNSKPNQEMMMMKRGRDHIISNEMNLENPYFPELIPPPPPPPVPIVVPYSNTDHDLEEEEQELGRFNDHASIRKLLIKLGGRFSSDDGTTFGNPQFHLYQPLLDHQQLISTGTSSSSSSSLGQQVFPLDQQFSDMEYKMMMVDQQISSDHRMPTISLPSTQNDDFVSELVKYDGLQGFLSGVDHDIMTMMDHNNNGAITNWGEMMNSLLLPSTTTTTTTLGDHHLRYHGARQC